MAHHSVDAAQRLVGDAAELDAAIRPIPIGLKQHTSPKDMRQRPRKHTQLNVELRASQSAQSPSAEALAIRHTALSEEAPKFWELELAAGLLSR